MLAPGRPSLRGEGNVKRNLTHFSRPPPHTAAAPLRTLRGATESGLSRVCGGGQSMLVNGLQHRSPAVDAPGHVCTCVCASVLIHTCVPVHVRADAYVRACILNPPFRRQTTDSGYCHRAIHPPAHKPNSHPPTHPAFRHPLTTQQPRHPARVFALMRSIP